MCGIAGIVGPNADRFTDELRSMLRSLKHRGPDEEGIWGSPSALMGIRRLAIIDPQGGHQPVVDSQAEVVVVANGEIYGHERIRESYADYPYRSGSDIEVIPALHRAHGTEFLDHLPGTFALALWEERPQQLTLARDRFGERPLYWATCGDLLVFASEPAALAASGLVHVTVDSDVLSHVVRQGYVPPGRSIWRGISSLPPASVLRWSVSTGPRVQRWWNPPKVVSGRRAEKNPVEWFRRELDRAVRDQLVADVPIGTFLSGGIDSSTVASLAARHHRNIAGFTFDMPGESELPNAQAVADLSGIDLHVFRPQGVDLVEALTDAARTWGEPLCDSSTIPTMLLSRFVRRSVKVGLTGDGADELLGGYFCWARPYLDQNDPVRSGIARRWWRPQRIPEGSAVARRYADFRSYFSAEELVALGLPAKTADDVDVDLYGRGTLEDILRFDLDHYLAGDILVKTDRASMATGLEVRAPFLDVAVAEGCLRLPSKWKVDHQREKILLREAFGDILPPEIVSRSKQGFGAPMGTWLKDPAIAELVRSELTDSSAPIAELLDPEALVSYAEGSGQQTWTLLTVALWWRHHRGLSSGLDTSC